MKSTSIFFEQRDFPQWIAIVEKFLKYGGNLRAQQSKDDPSNWWTLVKAVDREERQAQITKPNNIKET